MSGSSLKFIALALAALSSASPQVQAQTEYCVSAIANASSGNFAPYLIGSNNHGRIFQRNSAYIDAGFSTAGSFGSRFSWQIGVEGLAGNTSATTYDRWDPSTNSMLRNRQSVSNAWLQQCYASLNYRSLFLDAGLKEYESDLFNSGLGSGDFVESGNARPIPQLRGGFKDFVDIPLTKGWIQIQAILSYGVMTDDHYLRHHYNFYNYHITYDSWYTYKRVYFRSNPSQRLSVTAGAQVGAFFGGHAEFYRQGSVYRYQTYDKDLGSLINMIFPVFKEQEAFVQGQNLGSWDCKATLANDAGSRFSLYVQWPFEDGSGIAKRNGMDGVWGFEFNNPGKGLLSGAVIEYVDYRNQSGPIHYSSNGMTSSALDSNISGRDNYYNNSFYNAWANYGLSIGTPFLISPVYNTDGYPGFACNRMNGWHLGVKGWFTDESSYRFIASYRRGLGTYDYPYQAPRTGFSAMFESNLHLSGNWWLKGIVALDYGNLQGDNVGVLLSVTYKVSKKQARK